MIITLHQTKVQFINNHKTYKTNSIKILSIMVHYRHDGAQNAQNTILCEISPHLR